MLLLEKIDLPDAFKPLTADAPHEHVLISHTDINVRKGRCYKLKLPWHLAAEVMEHEISVTMAPAQWWREWYFCAFETTARYYITKDGRMFVRRICRALTWHVEEL